MTDNPRCTRRTIIRVGGGAACLIAVPSTILAEAAPFLPLEVAGVGVPRSAIATRAAAAAKAAYPDYLLNHCMRTFLFGALALKKQNITYKPDDAFVAAAFHDLGLLAAFASPRGSFEIDGADHAEAFMREANASEADAGIVWRAVELHDGKWALTKREGPEAMLVSLGAGADVGGPDRATYEQREVDEIIAAFPRLQFKKRFTDALHDHCDRKPTSQTGTWLESMCRARKPNAWTSTTEEQIAASPFAE